MLLVWAVVAIYVYSDAEKNDMPGCLWAVIVFLFGLLAFLIYLAIKYSGASSRRQKDYYPKSGGVYGSAPPPSTQDPRASGYEPTKLDPDFRDEYLEGLIEDGKFSASRKYLREMIQMAREMNDEGGVRNYAQYEVKINKAAMDGTRRRRDYDSH